MSNTTLTLFKSTLFESTLSSIDHSHDFCEDSVKEGLEIWLLVMAIIPVLISLITIAAILLAINALGKISGHQVEVENVNCWVRLNAKGTTCQPNVTDAFRSFALKNKELAKIA